jgi:hypothetical protein
MEWQRLGLENRVQASQLPSDCMAVAPCFGTRWRIIFIEDDGTLHAGDSCY